jgi:16S rRNA (uracil1498-N3)-methyltransferase
VKLSADESAHVVRSLRARRGDAVVLLDGEGLVVEGKLASADGDGAMVEVVRARVADPLSPAIFVAQGMPKGGTMDDLVRSCSRRWRRRASFLAESARCELKLDADRAAPAANAGSSRRPKRANSPVILGAPRSPRRSASANGSERLPAPVEGELRLTAILEFDAEPVAHLDFTKASKVIWLIGPEGDLTSEEYAAARAAGFRPVVLGPTVLRAENAALACVAITQALAKR